MSGVDVQFRGAIWFYLFISLAFLVSNHYQPWFNFYSEYLVFLGLFFFWCFSRREFLVTGFPVVLLLFFLIVVWGQFFLSIIEYAETAWLVSFYLGSAALAFMLGRQPGVIEVGAFCFFILGVVSSGIALGQWFDIWETVWVLTPGAGARVTANIGQANHLVTLLGLALVSAFWLRVKEHIGESVFTLTMLWLIMGMVLAASRMAFLQYAFICVFWYVFVGSRVSPSRLTCILGGVVLVVGAAWQANWALALHLIEPETALGVYERFGTTERLHIWWQLLLAAWDRGGLGYGWGQVAAAQVDYALAYPVPMFTLHAHSILVDILVWNGFFIGVIAILCSGMWLVRALWRVRDMDSAFAALCVITISIHALLEYPLEYSYFLIPFFLYLGYLGGRKIIWEGRVLVGFVAAIYFMFLAIVWRDYRVLEGDFRVLRFEMARVGTSGYSVADNEYYIFNGMGAFIGFMRFQLPGTLDEKIDEAGRLVYRYPYVPAFYRYSLLLIERGDYGQAADMLDRMRSVHGDENYYGTLAALKKDSSASVSLRNFINYIDAADGLDSVPGFKR